MQKQKKKASQIKKKTCKCVPTIFQIRRGRTFWGVKAASPPPVFGIVVYKHVVWDSHHVAIHIDCCWYNNLEETTKPSSFKKPYSFAHAHAHNQLSLKTKHHGAFLFALNEVNDNSEYIFVYVANTGDF